MYITVDETLNVLNVFREVLLDFVIFHNMVLKNSVNDPYVRVLRSYENGISNPSFSKVHSLLQ